MTYPIGSKSLTLASSDAAEDVEQQDLLHCKQITNSKDTWETAYYKTKDALTM